MNIKEKNFYKEMSKAERNREIKALKKDIKKISLPLKDLEDVLVYLEYLGAREELEKNSG